MSPKRSSSGKKSPARKAAARKPSRATKPESPMRKIEHRAGPNTDGLADQARSAHQLPPEVPNRTAARTSAPASPPAMNTPPDSSPSSPAVDQGQEK